MIAHSLLFSFALANTNAHFDQVVPEDSTQMGALDVKNCVEAEAEVLEKCQFVNETKDRLRDDIFQGDSLENVQWMAFANSVAMILATELGDKTFFIAAILAMRHGRRVVFVGAISALALMTVLSAGIGFILPSIFPRLYTHYAAVCLFAFFGVKLNLDAIDLHNKGEGEGPSEELAEVDQSLRASRTEGAQEVLIQAFTLTFVAEWADRSQIATIALAAAKDPFCVTAGGICGHSICTGLAVLGGRMLAARISERAVLLFGGSLFLIFAAHGAYVGPNFDNI